MNADFACVRVLTYNLERRAPCGGRHPPVLFREFSHSYLLSLEGQEQIIGRGSALTVDSRDTLGASGDNDAVIAVCVAVGCCTV